MEQTEVTQSATRWWLLGLALLVGVLLAAAIPQPVIGIIRLEDAIYSYTARDMITQINYAIEHPEVRAVVLVFESPGGTVVDTEAVYMELTRLREKKPVVTAVNGMAASGAYYLAVNTDAIYVKPTSMIGNVGVIGYLPPSPFIFEDIISTGPYKLWGAPRDSDMRQIDMIKEGFAQAVKLGRGKKLKIEDELLLSGQIWNGVEAVRMGVADKLGTEQEALDRAAQLARVANYKAADLRALAGVSLQAFPFFLQSPEGITLPYPSKPGLYLLYIPPLPAGQ